MTPVHPDTLAALSAGIQSEVASYVFYVEAAKKSLAVAFRDVLKKLALEEKEHFHILERQHHSLIKSEKWISTADVLKMEGLPKISEAMSAAHRDLVAEVQKADSVLAILDIAYRLEEEAYELFSREAERTVAREGKKIFEELARFEQGHMALISSMMKAHGG